MPTLISSPHKKIQFLLSIITFYAVFTCIPHYAAAHGVYMYAWPEGGRICTESYYSRADKVQHGEVQMLGPDKTVLASTSTNTEGIACFSLPATATPLSFVVTAGQGHRGTCSISQAQVETAFATAQSALQQEKQNPSANTTQTPTPPTSTQPADSTIAPSAASPAAPTAKLPATTTNLAKLDEETLRKIIREELQNQLGPIHQKFAQVETSSAPGPVEIGGGIGWILGLAAIASLLYAKRRGK